MCPACGGLECLCRPRFYAGQLLTEEELNGLESYVVEKNKLHNRYLHGWGTVCGLEVVCHPCSDRVTVKAGYALSPCGEDIIVCRDESVPICAMIEQCRTKERDWECEPPRDAPDAEDCRTEQTWLLAIRYDERAARGTKPLQTRACTCGGSCGGGGGGHSSGGCGCGGKSNGNGNGHAKTEHASHGATPQRGGTRTTCRPALECEPSVTCETYRFEVFPAPPPVRDRSPLGNLGETALIKRVADCIEPLLDALTDVPTGPDAQDPQKLHDWCCDMKRGLLEFAGTHAVTSCCLLDQLKLIVCPPPSAFPGAFPALLQEFLEVAAGFLFDCLCSAFLPPCPEPVTDPRVVLAAVTVSFRDGCRVERVCNWTIHRKFTTTFPALQYWLSWLPVVRLLRDALERGCCRPCATRRPRDVTPSRPSRRAGRRAGGGGEPPVDAEPARAAERAGAAEPLRAAERPSEPSPFRPRPLAARRSRDLARLAVNALVRRERALDNRSLIMGLTDARDDNDEPYLTDLERENAPQLVILNHIARPILESMVSPQTFGLLRGALTGSPAAAGVAAMVGAEETRMEVLDLRERVDQQQRTIDTLINRIEMMNRIPREQ
jgi:hypothetical protein